MGSLWFAEGDRYLRAGNGGRAFLHLVRAEAVFPLIYYTRETNAVVRAISEGMQPEIVLDAIDRALAADPYGGNLLWHKMIQELRRGDAVAAEAALVTLERVGPGWSQTATARRIFDDMTQDNRGGRP